jgi:hypothetical protein
MRQSSEEEIVAITDDETISSTSFAGLSEKAVTFLFSLRLRFFGNPTTVCFEPFGRPRFFITGGKTIDVNAISYSFQIFADYVEKMQTLYQVSLQISMWTSI